MDAHQNLNMCSSSVRALRTLPWKSGLDFDSVEGGANVVMEYSVTSQQENEAVF